LAITALVLGIFSLFTVGLTALPAILVGIIALVVIHESRGRLAGTGPAIAGIVISVLSLLLVFGMVVPTLMRVRQLATRATCGTNLSGIGKTMLLYSNDYRDQLPTAGGPNISWGEVANWTATSRQEAFGLAADHTGGKATISSCFYLLIRYTEMPPAAFVCYGDSGTTKFLPSALGGGGAPADFELVNGWDFGPPGESWRHCSYAYHIPFGHPPLVVSKPPGFALVADRNPFLDSPRGAAIPLRHFKPDLIGYGGTVDTARQGNTPAHQFDGQNVMFLDTHVNFEKRANCGIEDDNIYLVSNDPAKGSPVGAVPGVPSVMPANSNDSVLVHDPERFETP